MKYIEIDHLPTSVRFELEDDALHHLTVPEGAASNDLLFSLPPQDPLVARKFFISIDCPDNLNDIPNWRMYGNAAETIRLLVPSEVGSASLLLRPGVNVFRFTEISVSTFMVFTQHSSGDEDSDET
jgi:hypothetical protein